MAKGEESAIEITANVGAIPGQWSLDRENSTIHFPFDEAQVVQPSVGAMRFGSNDVEKKIQNRVCADEKSPINESLSSPIGIDEFGSQSIHEREEKVPIESDHSFTPPQMNINEESGDEKEKSNQRTTDVLPVDFVMSEGELSSKLNEASIGTTNANHKQRPVNLMTRQSARKNLEVVENDISSSLDDFRLSSLKRQEHMKVIPNLKRQPRFKVKTKGPQMMKGVSAINITQLDKYDTELVKDSTATKSKKIAKSKIREQNNGDGDVWVETLFRHQETNEIYVFFVSKNTGAKIHDEPPSGASRIIYLKESERKRIK